MKKNHIQLLLFIFSIGLIMSSFTFYTPQEDWAVPAKYKNMKNPTKADQDVDIAKSLYDKHCKSCHGKSGLGDGPKSKELDTDAGDFSVAKFQAQSDGELFYKTTFGRDDMPAYDKKIANDEDRWLIVNYMRTFKK